MEDARTLFTDTLSSLLELAKAKGNRLSKGEIHFYFKDQIKEEAQYDFIYRFLAEKGVTVEGYAAPKGADTTDATLDNDSVVSKSSRKTAPKKSRQSALTPQEKNYLSLYEADLTHIKPITDEERVRLCNAMRAGDESAMNRLIEGHLYLVMELLPYYLGSGVRIGDLIQEGNLGLMMGISSYAGTDFIAHAKESIRSAMDAIVKEYEEADDVANHLLERINLMDRVSREMAMDLGREPTKEELAERLHTDVEEVESIIKHSIDALTVSVDDEEYGKDFSDR